MVPIRGEWTRFTDIQDQLEHYRLWGLIPEKSKSLRPVMVVDGYFDFPEPCQVVGYQTDKVAVIELADGYHAVRGEHLTELQPEAHQRLPRGLCFVEVLSHYVVVDIETTGFNRHHDRIIEIAAARYEYGQQIDTFQTFVNPGLLIPSDIEKLTGITQQDVDTAPELEAVIPRFMNYIGSLPIVGHNAVSFDVPFLSEQMQVDFANPVVDTLPMARKVYHLLPHHKLEYLKTALDLNYGASHRALADVETTNALLWACMAPRHYESKMWHAVLNKEHSRSSTKQTMSKKRTPQTTLGKAKTTTSTFDKSLMDLVNTEREVSDIEQMDLFASTVTEEWVYGLLKDSLSSVIARNNVDQDRLKLKEGKSYSSVWYDTQMAFRICCRDNHRYFSVSNLYSVQTPENLQEYITFEGRSDGYTNFRFIPDREGVLEFATFLSSVLGMAIDSISKEFDCCSRFKECSNAKQCTNPNVSIATGCGYRRIMKKGRIFYGENRNVD